MRGIHTYTGRIRPANSRVPEGRHRVDRGLAPWTHIPRSMRTPSAAQAGVRQHAGDIRQGMGMVQGGEELALLVVKTALASGMKNSLALVVKNGLRPW
mgnify:CR=1 FL=1